MWRCNRAGNLIICVSSRLQTRFTAQPRRLNGVIMIQIASSDFITAAKEDGCHSAQQFCQFIERTSGKSSIWLSWTLTHPRWFSHSAHLSLLPNFRVPLRDVDRCVSLMLKKSPSFLDTKLDSNDAKWKKTVPFSYSLSSSLHSGDLHSMMSLFPIIPLEAPPAKRWSLPTFRPCQSNLSNLSKGQRPDRSSCIPIKLNTIEM